jgi:RNA polymerase sigma-70 factor (ECF subfamily)
MNVPLRLPAAPVAVDEGLAPPDFLALYDEQVDFVWRMVERLGVPRSALEDAVQDVFLGVHRGLADFRGESTLRTWIGGICLRVARDYRRRSSRGGATEPLESCDELARTDGDPHTAAENAQALALLNRLLDTLDQDQRTAFVLSELEDYSAPEIAQLTEANLNTVYSRIRLAKSRLNALVARHRLGGEQP